MVGARGNSSQYHVFELEANLPKFSTLVGDSEASAVNGSRSRRIKESRTNANIVKCVFYINERVDRVHQWASQAFLGLGDGKTGPLRGGKNSLLPHPPLQVNF